MKKFICIALIGFLGIYSNTLMAQRRPAAKNKQVVVRKNKRKTVVVKKLPAKSVVVVHKKNNYHFNQGRFYRKSNGNYSLIIPPRGLRLKALPVSYKRILIRNKPYFYSYGVFYIQTNDEYEVIDSPEGAIIDSLPEETEIVTIDGQEYHEYGETLFLPIEEDGIVRYQVHSQLSE